MARSGQVKFDCPRKPSASEGFQGVPPSLASGDPTRGKLLTVLGVTWEPDRLLTPPARSKRSPSPPPRGPPRFEGMTVLGAAKLGPPICRRTKGRAFLEVRNVHRKRGEPTAKSWEEEPPNQGTQEIPCIGFPGMKPFVPPTDRKSRTVQ